MVSLYVKGCPRRILTAISKRHQLCSLGWVGYALCIEELGRKELSSLCEAGSEVPQW